MKLKIAKTCAYCSTNYNLTPALLLTPLRTSKHEPDPKWLARPLANKATGFRLALKFLRVHLGIEVHFE